MKLALRLATDGLFLAFSGSAYSLWIEPEWLEVTHIPLSLPRLPGAFVGLRLAQLSDIHLGGWMDARRLQRVIACTLRLQPDLVVVTGDFVYGRSWNHPSLDATVTSLAEAFLPLTRACPVLAVLGNHDYWVDAAAVRQALALAGILELNNAVHTLERGGQRLHICGVDDVWERHSKLERILDVVPPGEAAILLAHEPDFARSSAPTGRFDLQLSGHTHGGQIVLPFLGAPVRPHMGRMYPASGLCQVGEMYLYTSRGVGMAGVPVRFNCRPEIPVFHLAADSGGAGSGASAG